MFVKEVYEILRASPQWNQTLFVITYDEHGGFYDHVATPVSGVPSPDGIVGPEPFLFGFDRLGVRVPTIMVSPWIDKGTGMYVCLNNIISKVVFMLSSFLFYLKMKNVVHGYRIKYRGELKYGWSR